MNAFCFSNSILLCQKEGNHSYSNSMPCFPRTTEAQAPTPNLQAHSQAAMAVIMKTQIELSWSLGGKVQLPDDLVVTHNHVQFLKLRASHWCLSKLLLGYRKGYTSFAKAPCLTKLKNLRKEALLAKLQDPAEEEDPLRLNSNQGSESSQKGSKECAKESKTMAAMKTDMVVEIQVGDCPVSILCEKAHFEKTDLLAQMEEKQLAAIFKFLEPDLEGMRQERPEKAAAPKEVQEKKSRSRAQQARVRTSSFQLPGMQVQGDRKNIAPSFQHFVLAQASMSCLQHFVLSHAAAAHASNGAQPSRLQVTVAQPSAALPSTAMAEECRCQETCLFFSVMRSPALLGPADMTHSQKVQRQELNHTVE